MIKICFISDLHGYLINDIEPCDLVIICGDSISLRFQSGWHKAIRWYRNQFKSWAEALPCDKVFFIAGNHDPIESYEEEMKLNFPMDSKVSYICHEYCEFTKDGTTLKMFGSPYCHVFGHWYFMEDDNTLATLFNEIPKNLDIVFTHDAPYGITDVLLDPKAWNSTENLGCRPLADAIIEAKPAILAHGHLHSTSHVPEEYNGTKYFNCSIVDEEYQPVYDPIYIEW
jgi:Icc-related predicted phosphoesterase